MDLDRVEVVDPIQDKIGIGWKLQQRHCAFIHHVSRLTYKVIPKEGKPDIMLDISGGAGAVIMDARHAGQVGRVRQRAPPEFRLEDFQERKLKGLVGE